MAGNAWEFCVIKRPPLRFNNKSCHHFCLLTLFVDHRSSSANTCSYRTISNNNDCIDLY